LIFSLTAILVGHGLLLAVLLVIIYQRLHDSPER
jgi:hypothetical protein